MPLFHLRVPDMRFVQCAHCRHENTAFRTRLRSYIRNGAQDCHVSSFIQVRPVRECHSRKRRASDVLLESALIGRRHSVRAVVRGPKRRAEDCPPYHSGKQNENTGDHQREHPDQVDVEPRAAQYRDPKFFVNHNRDQRGR